MILTDEQIKADDEKWKCRDVKQELRYLGYATPTRTSVTNDDIKFVACMARKALKMLDKIICCHDCAHSEYDAVYGDRYCHYNGKAEIVPDNHFCGYAERRETDEICD